MPRGQREINSTRQQNTREKDVLFGPGFDKLTGLDVPELDGAVVGGGDHELGVELEAGHRRLVLVRTWTKRKSAIRLCDEQ